MSESINKGFRLAHTMMRVMDMDKSIEFYCGILGMEVQRRTDYPEGKFTNTFIGYGPEAEFPTLELTAKLPLVPVSSSKSTALPRQRPSTIV